jgi:hypothetical protein
MIFLIALGTGTIATLRTGTTLTSFAIPFFIVITTITTFATIATLATLRTLTALSGRTLLIALGLLDEYTVRELELTSLRINLEQLDGDLVTLLDTCLLDGLEALPVDLRDVEQTILARHELYETAVRHDAANGTLVNLANLRDSDDSTDLGDSSVD